MSETATENATATASKTTKHKASKKNAKAMAAASETKTPKVASAAKPKPEKKPKAPRESREGWGTFALKMPIAERESFHAASGSAGASRFARIVLNAFSNDDTAAFAAAIAESKQLR